MQDGLLEITAWTSLGLAVASAAVIVIDIARGQRQHMWIMNLVWPLTALYSGPLGLWAYWRIGRLSTHERMMQAEQRQERPPSETKPFWQTAMVGTTHCGSGCTLGDLIVESFTAAVPLTLFDSRITATWVLDYIAAFAFGIAFQYFTIKPMRQLSVKDGLKAALKADSASLTAWQLGMYGWMAIVIFTIVGHELPKSSPVFWFMMQIAMLFGFLTSYPVNRWLIRAGIKEAM